MLSNDVVNNVCFLISFIFFLYGFSAYMNSKKEFDDRQKIYCRQYIFRIMVGLLFAIQPLIYLGTDLSKDSMAYFYFFSFVFLILLFMILVVFGLIIYKRKMTIATLVGYGYLLGLLFFEVSSRFFI